MEFLAKLLSLRTRLVTLVPIMNTNTLSVRRPQICISACIPFVIKDFQLLKFQARMVAGILLCLMP